MKTLNIAIANMKKTIAKKKRALTLVEILVVMAIIGMITGALAYNYQKSLETGREFKTREIISRVETVLNLALADGQITTATLSTKWKDTLAQSPLIQNSDHFTKDGWSQELAVTTSIDPNTQQTIVKVESPTLKTRNATVG